MSISIAAVECAWCVLVRRELERSQAPRHRWPAVMPAVTIHQGTAYCPEHVSLVMRGVRP